MHGPAAWAALFAVGLVAGALNVIAGGGSFLTLPMLIFLGLPPTLANGTNRVAIGLQNVGAVWGFHRHRAIDWSWAVAAAVPAAGGAGLGAWAALEVGDEAFRKILAFLMVAISLWTLFVPTGRRRGGGEAGGEPRGDGRPPTTWRQAPPLQRWGLVAGFFAVGVYGGFVQAGVGFLILAATSLVGFDLVRGNAVKVLAILSFTTLSLLLFAWQGQVDWSTGLILAVGTVAGSQIGVHLTVLKGHRWVRGVVTAAVIVFAVKLWLG